MTGNNRSHMKLGFGVLVVTKETTAQWRTVGMSVQGFRRDLFTGFGLMLYNLGEVSSKQAAFALDWVSSVSRGQFYDSLNTFLFRRQEEWRTAIVDKEAAVTWLAE